MATRASPTSRPTSRPGWRRRALPQALGGVARQMAGVPFAEFLAPGLIMMTMVQNAFANTSSSIVIAKVQGNIVDVLMPPISAGELFTGYMVGGVIRGFIVGAVCAIAVWLTVGINIHAFWAILLFGILGNALLSSLGLAAGIWSEKFDHIAAVTNFIVTPHVAWASVGATDTLARQLVDNINGFWAGAPRNVLDPR